jgi:hypothetical protein
MIADYQAEMGDRDGGAFGAAASAQALELSGKVGGSAMRGSTEGIHNTPIAASPMPSARGARTQTGIHRRLYNFLRWLFKVGFRCGARIKFLLCQTRFAGRIRIRWQQTCCQILDIYGVKTMTLKRQFITDATGAPIGVILPKEEYALVREQIEGRTDELEEDEEAKLQLMEKAAHDPQFLANLHETMTAFAHIDSKWWEPAE